MGGRHQRSVTQRWPITCSAGRAGGTAFGWEARSRCWRSTGERLAAAVGAFRSERYARLCARTSSSRSTACTGAREIRRAQSASNSAASALLMSRNCAGDRFVNRCM